MSLPSNRLDDVTHERVLRERILPAAQVSTVTSQTRPVAILLAGQPGAGKGQLARTGRAELGGNAVIVDPDELRDLHPDVAHLRAAHPYTWSDYTHADASQWADQLLDATVAAKKNLIFDTTLSNGPWSARLVERLRAQGYEVEIRAVVAHRLESELGVERRFSAKLDDEGHARYVPTPVRDKVYPALPDSLDVIHERTGVTVRLFDREGVELYDSRADARAPGAALRELREARLADPDVTRQTAHGWREQKGWHDTLPDRLAGNPRVAPPVADALLTEREAGGVVPQVRSHYAAADAADVRTRLLPNTVRGMTAVGAVATLADAARTAQRTAALLEQDNLLGASHELRDFAAHNTAAWATAYALGRAGAAAGGRRGLYGAVVGGVVGSVAGYALGDVALQRLDMREVAHQTDARGVAWTYDGRQWVSDKQADLRDDGIDRPQAQAFAADFDTRRELDYRATNTAFDLALARLPAPRDPYTQPPGPHDEAADRGTPWIRDPATHAWTREIPGPFAERGLTPTRSVTATPERAAELDAQAAATIATNIATGPAAVAARYDALWHASGWADIGTVQRSRAVDAALDPSRLRASDGHLYDKTPDGSWQHGEVPASPRIAAELDATQAALLPQLAQHARTMAALPAWSRPSPEALDLAELQYQYAIRGVAPDDDTLVAAYAAVQGTRARLGLDPAITSVALDPERAAGHDVRSPLVHLQTGRDGVIRVVGTTTYEDIERARVQQGQTASPDAPPTEPPSVRRPEATGGPAPAPAHPREAMRTPGPRLADDPAHPDHAGYARIHEWVRGTGQWDEACCRNVAAALYAKCVANPLLPRVDRVTGGLGRDGAHNVFAVYQPFGDCEPRFTAHVDSRDAARIPAQQSLEQAKQAREAQSRSHTQERERSRGVALAM